MPGFRFFVSVAAAVSCIVLSAVEPRAAAAETYNVDAVHSTVLFRVKHMNTSYSWGRFNDIAGTVTLDDPSPSLEVRVQVDSVDTGNTKRDAHLKAPDFFSAKQYPTIAFKSTKVTKVDDAHYDVDGTLTLHGVTKPITVKLERTGAGKGPMGGTITGVATEFKIKRSDYGMKFMLAGASDDVLVIVALECAGP
jgi:polyisoprenoid-binding protein YceI